MRIARGIAAIAVLGCLSVVVAPSGPASGATPAPAPPTGVILRVGDAELTAFFKPSSSGTPTSYTASDDAGHSCSPQSLTPGGNGYLWCALDGLTDGSTYTVSVTATNAYGTSAPSAVASGVPQSSSATLLQADWSSMTATVSPGPGSLAPAGLTPTGSVVFTVNGTSVATVPLSGGVASLNYQVPPGATMRADYSGDAAFYSSDSYLSVPTTLTPTTDSWIVAQDGRYHFTLGASGGEGAYAFAAVGPLPSGVSMTPTGAATVAINGSSTAPYKVTFTYKVTDGAGPFQASATRAVSIIVNPGPLYFRTPHTLPSTSVGAAYSTQVIKVGRGWGTDEFKLVGGSLPAGMWLTPLNTYAGKQYVLFGGRPKVAGKYAFELEAIDQHHLVTKSWLYVTVQ